MLLSLLLIISQDGQCEMDLLDGGRARLAGQLIQPEAKVVEAGGFSKTKIRHFGTYPVSMYSLILE